jgi:TonB family protein
MRIVVLAWILLFALNCVAQSGRKLKVVTVPPPAAEEITPPAKPRPTESPQVTAEKHESYRCTEDGTLARIITSDAEQMQTFTPKQVDTRATILERPAASYTREARRKNVQGFVILNVVLSSQATIDRVTVVRGLPAGLTENAIRAACKIRFKPAIKEGKAVSQTLLVEYNFRIATSSILNP